MPADAAPAAPPSFARTKIQPPRPRAGALVERPALEARLAQALRSARLVLLCAGAGFGKTSAMARQLGQLAPGTACAWVSCDEDDTPAQLFSCLLAALEPFDLPWRTEPDALARAASEATSPALRRRIAAEVINALDASDVPHGLIVVDDLHRVTAPEVHDFLDALLERLSPRWTLVLLTRREPPLALPRLRAMGELAEFGLDDLRLDRDESRALAAGAGLGTDAADRLHERTLGWAAGLRLALNSARVAAVGPSASPGAAIDRAMFEFLADEVIDQLEPALRDFLVAVSVLPELTAARCAAVSGDARAAQHLDEVERRGLFMTRLDAHEHTLRLHDLFREALEVRHARLPAAERARVLAAAAHTEPDPVKQVSWLMRAERWDDAVALLLAQGARIALHGRPQAVREAIERLPAERYERSAGLQLLLGQLGWGRWDWDTALSATERASQLFEAEGHADEARNARSYHAVALVASMDPGAHAYVQRQLADPALQGAGRARTLWTAAMCATRGDQRDVADDLSRMLDALSGVRDPMRWYECCPIPPMVGLPGTRAPLLGWLAGVRHVLPEQPTPLRGMVHTMQGWLHLAAGQFDAAEADAAEALADSRWLARPVNVDSYARGLRAVGLALRGRVGEALDDLQDLIDGFDSANDRLRRELYGSLYGYLGLRCAALADNPSVLAGWLQRLRLRSPGGRSWLSAGQQANERGYQCLASGDLEQACATWREILAQQAHADLYGQVHETRLRLADALHRRQRPPSEATAVLAPLFDGVDRSGEWGLLLLAGPAVLQRLADADWGDNLPQARRQQLADWTARARTLSGASTAPVTVSTADPPAPVPAGVGAPAPQAVSGGATPLSAREWEVLACMAAGDPNKVIARNLDLSPHTVKRHVANILDKLALSTRGQASAWYHEHR